MTGGPSEKFVGRPPRDVLVAVTIDSETWHPLPPKERIDWSRDVLEPTAALLDTADRNSVKVTFMAEIGEYLWLQHNDRLVAEAMAAQWSDAVVRGHDVQLHLHPSWLPELGARREGDNWYWDWSVAKASDYPGDLSALLARCRIALEEVLRAVKPDYVVTCFRAGAYQAQPFRRLYDALVTNGILCDSSVYAGGRSVERGYDYSEAVSNHQPYFASPYDPQFRASPAEERLIELPIFTYEPGARWVFDGEEGARAAGRLLDYLDHGSPWSPPPWMPSPLAYRAKQVAASRYVRGLRSGGRGRVRRDEGGPEFFVLIGHTKGCLDVDGISRSIEKLQSRREVAFVTLSEMALEARTLLRAVPAAPSLERTIEASYHGSQAAADDLAAALPLDRDVVSAGTESLRRVLSTTHPWARIDAGSPQGVGQYDAVAMVCTMADGEGLDRDLEAAFRALRIGGVVILTFPSTAAWRPAPKEIRLRLQRVGFLEIVEVRPASGGGEWTIRAWKRTQLCSRLERAVEIMDWVYRNLKPDRPSEGENPVTILRGGFAYCWGYAVVLGRALEREGYTPLWVTMIADGMPNGRGRLLTDSHEVVLTTVEEGEVILDAMANTLIPHPLLEVLRTPGLAKPKAAPDERYSSRGYAHYDTDFWYRRVKRYGIRRRPEARVWYWWRNRWRAQPR